MLARLLLALCCLVPWIAASAAAPGAKPPHKVMMMLYRGMTDAEKGFMNYFKKRNIAVDFIIRDAQADSTRIADFVREARELKPDLIYTFGTTVTTEVVGALGEIDPARHITDIPVVFDVVADPIGAKLVANLKSSGRNVTGASHLVPLAAQLQALQAMRNIQSLGVIYNPQEKNSVLTVHELETMAARMGLALQLAPIETEGGRKLSEEALEKTMRALVAKKPQFIYIPSDSFLIKHARTVTQVAQAERIPVFAATEAPIRNDGALLGLVSTYFNVGELAAHKAAQILAGKAAPAQLPVESLKRFTYLVNMDAARKLGVYPPLAVVKIAELIGSPDGVDARE